MYFLCQENLWLAVTSILDPCWHALCWIHKYKFIGQAGWPSTALSLSGFIYKAGVHGVITVQWRHRVAFNCTSDWEWSKTTQEVSWKWKVGSSQQTSGTSGRKPRAQ